MPYFDRFDICAAHCLLERDYNVSGILQERPSNTRRRMSTEYQLWLIGFKPSPLLSFETLTENGQAIYRELERRYGFTESTAQTILAVYDEVLEELETTDGDPF